MLPTEIHFLPDPEIAQTLAENGIDLMDALRRAGIKAEVMMAANPILETDGAKREPVTVIVLAVGFSAVMLAQALSRIIGQLQSKPVIVKQQVLAPVEDSSGRPQTAADGRPLLYWRDSHELIQPAPPTGVAAEAMFKLPLGFEVKLATSEQVKDGA